MHRSAILLAALLALPVAAHAEKPGNQRHKHHEKKAEARIAFSTSQREAAHRFFVGRYGRGNCPPGLAKKHNGCLPPGQAKKRYVVGRRLAEHVKVERLPRELADRLGPAPHGYRYGIVDGDLVELAVGTLLVVDAIGGLVD